MTLFELLEFGERDAFGKKSEYVGRIFATQRGAVESLFDKDEGYVAVHDAELMELVNNQWHDTGRSMYFIHVKIREFDRKDKAEKARYLLKYGG